MKLPHCTILILFTLGCVHRTTTCCRFDAGPSLPVVERGIIEPDPDTPHGNPLPVIHPIVYRAISADEVARLAYAHCAAADLLESEAAHVRNRCCLKRLHGKRKARELQVDLLELAAQEMRQTAAATAVVGYYTLAELETQHELNGLSLREAETALEKGRSLEAKGLKLPFDLRALERQESALRIQRGRLEQAIDQANALLRMGLGIHEDVRLRPTDDFTSADAWFDEDSAVSDGLAQRHALLTLRRLALGIEAETLPAVRQATQSVGKLIAVAESDCPLMSYLAMRLGLDCLMRRELDHRRNQLERLLAEKERDVEREIRQAVRQLDRQAEILGLQQAKARTWKERVAELEDRERKGMGSTMDLAAARLEWYQSRANLARELMAWHTARALLKQAQGTPLMDHSCTPTTLPDPQFPCH